MLCELFHDVTADIYANNVEGTVLRYIVKPYLHLLPVHHGVVAVGPSGYRVRETVSSIFGGVEGPIIVDKDPIILLESG